MKYAIIGAGGTGGCLGFFLQKAGKDVTLIARGKHLEAIRKNGLTIQKLWDESRETLPVKACTAEEYKEIPYELKFLAYFMDLKSEDYEKIRCFLNQAYGGV